MNKKLYFLFASLAITLTFNAQRAFYSNYEFPETTPKADQVTAEEQKTYKGIILQETKAREIALSANETAEYYYFYSVSVLLNDDDVIEKFNKIYISYSNSSQLVTFKCRVTKPDGKSVELYKGDMKTITEDGSDYYILALEGLEKGAIVEYYYLKQIPVVYYLSDFVGNKYYIKKYTSQMISPDNIVYKHKSYNQMPTGKDTTYSNRNFVTFELNNLKPVADERYCTNSAHLKRAEIVLDYNKNNSTKKLNTYSDISKTLIKDYYEKVKEDEKVIDKLYKKLEIEKKTSFEEKIFTIESYLKNEIAIIKQQVNLTLKQCLDNKVLNTYYRNKVIVGLFERAGISYELVCTSNKNNQPFDPEFESYAFLDETFFYLPESKKYFFPEDILARYPNGKPSMMGQKGLFIKPLKIGDVVTATNSIKEIAEDKNPSNYSNMECDINIKKENAVSMFITHTYNGEPGKELRALTHYYDVEKREELINTVLKGGYKDAKVTLAKALNYDLKDYTKYNQPVSYSGFVETAELSEVAGQNIILKVGLTIGVQSELYQSEKRVYPIYTGYPHTYKRIITVNIPAGYTVEGLEKLNSKAELKENGEVTAYFTSGYKKEGDKVIIEVNESYSKENYKIEDFEAFRAVINAAADFNKVSLLLKKN